MGYRQCAQTRTATAIERLRTINSPFSEAHLYGRFRPTRPMPDAPGTIFTMRHGKVAEIDIFYA